MKKAMAMVLAMVMMVMFAGGAMACPGQGYWSTQVWVSGDCNLRVGPGLCYRDIGTIHVGEAAAYLGNPVSDERGVVWYNVCFRDTVGWVSSVYANLDTQRMCWVIADGGNSNVRTGPSLCFEDVGTLHRGESAVYLGNQSIDERGVVWYNVSWNGSSAWISSRYTSLG